MFTRSILIALSVLTGIFVSVVPAGATDWFRLTLASGAGYATMDETFLMEDGVPLEGRVGLTLFRYLGVEGTYGKILATRDRVPDHDFPVDHYGLDLIINLAPGSNINPYIFGGWGELDLDDTLSTRVDMNGYEFGGGLKIALARKSGVRVDLRLEGRDVVVKNDPPLLSVGEDTHDS